MFVIVTSIRPMCDAEAFNIIIHRKLTTQATISNAQSKYNDPPLIATIFNDGMEG
jgi:hypothetical protein